MAFQKSIISLYAAIKELTQKTSFLGLVWETKFNPKRRVDEALQLLVLRQLVRVVLQKIHVLVIELDDGQVLLDPTWCYGLGEHCASPGN
jgi:hypothetical protein